MAGEGQLLTFGALKTGQGAAVTGQIKGRAGGNRAGGLRKQDVAAEDKGRLSASPTGSGAWKGMD